MYTSSASPIYLCFLDASKAFDRVNHHTLFHKLLRKGLPQPVVRPLRTWYSNQTMQVRWSTYLWEPFTVSNGVRQGGILSPIFFNVYLEDLSNDLLNTPAGCFIGYQSFNHVFMLMTLCC